LPVFFRNLDFTNGILLDVSENLGEQVKSLTLGKESLGGSDFIGSLDIEVLELFPRISEFTKICLRHAFLPVRSVDGVSFNKL
jgi:hypothetical protein